MPRRNVPAPNAIKTFHCNLCDKGYPRQTEYDKHLQSYDHTHRERMVGMKKIQGDNEASKKRPFKSSGSADMRRLDKPNKKPTLGPKFTKIGEASPFTDAPLAGANFKRIDGKGAASIPTEVTTKKGAVNKPTKPKLLPGEELIDWEQYDFTKPSGCTYVDPKMLEGIWDDEWIVIDAP